MYLYDSKDFYSNIINYNFNVYKIINLERIK